MAALPEEVVPLLGRLSGPEPAGPPRRRPAGERPWIVRGRLAGRELALIVTGDGAGNAGPGLRRALRVVEPGRLVVIGVGGGLAPELAPGSLVVGRRVVDAGGRVLVADPELVEAARDALRRNAREGVVATLARLADTPARKAALRSGGRFGGGAAETLRPDVADLESAVYAAEARAAGLPWVVLRAVSDAAWESLPAYLERSRDGRGGVRRSRVLAHALLRPWTFPDLLRLRGRVRVAAARLADAVESTVAVVPATPGAAAGEPR